jgi:hypothetical protein
MERAQLRDNFEGDRYLEISDATSYKSTLGSAAVLGPASIFCWSGRQD